MRAFPTEALFFLHTRWHFSVFLDWSRVPRGRFFCHNGVRRTNATTTDFGVPFGFFFANLPDARARSLRTPLLTDGHLKIKNVTPNV